MILKKFLDCIINQTNHLKKNIKFENDLSKKIEILTAIILTGLVFKEYEENFNLGIKELENLIKNFLIVMVFLYREILMI